MSDMRTPWAEGIGHVTPVDGNVFSDLGLPDAEELLAKARLVQQISHLVEAHGWTQAQAAKRLRTTQPKVSDLMRGRLGGFSLAKLLHFLTLLDQDIEVIVRQKPETQSRAALRVHIDGDRAPQAALTAHRAGGGT